MFQKRIVSHYKSRSLKKKKQIKGSLIIEIKEKKPTIIIIFTETKRYNCLALTHEM